MAGEGSTSGAFLQARQFDTDDASRQEDWDPSGTLSNVLTEAAGNVTSVMTAGTPDLDRSPWLCCYEPSPSINVPEGKVLTGVTVTLNDCRQTDAGGGDVVANGGLVKVGSTATHSGVRKYTAPSAVWGKNTASSPESITIGGQNDLPATVDIDFVEALGFGVCVYVEQAATVAADDGTNPLRIDWITFEVHWADPEPEPEEDGGRACGRSRVRTR